MTPFLGLMHSSRRSTEIPLASIAPGAHMDEGDASNLVKESAQATGGMLESIANMANSILGAGIIGALVIYVMPSLFLKLDSKGYPTP